ncbi:hypothetical protein IX49_12265 [Cellulophaga lytica]|uniref:RagB/SusD family nutrient uptake outer membrane protein n=1 Tax=Cellulophaga lytica TaxID=979 RepID=UPI0004F5C3DB|nr:RagB/SusD family nutrient uptake outer membrane protein [Cellulophaga lytica]AIM61256.1 hypothetical protein IX49_12265 [Cellulophaga lytica]
MKKTYKYIAILLLITAFSSCDDFLEENPSKNDSVTPESLEDFEALLNNYNEFSDEAIFPLIYGSDDFELSTNMHDNFNRAYSPASAIFGTWNTELAANESGRFSGWPAEWEKIFTANYILEQIDAVAASEEEKANIKAECYFIRAYSYFVLANVYCLPYSTTNLDELGLPIKQTTSFSESTARVSLGETYDFIESNLMNALKITREFSQVNGLNNSWRASTAAVNGFAARYYLALNEYALAQDYAQNALDEYSNLRNYNTDMRFSDIPAFATIFNPTPERVELLYPYTHDQQNVAEDRLEFGEAYYYRMLSNPSWANWPSQELLNLYDDEYDLRYRYHIVEDYSYSRGAIAPPFSYPGYIFFFKDDIPSGPSVPEMLLIKAECQIRQGAWADGLQTANLLRAARMDATAPVDAIELSALNQNEALTKVLEERRREMPFVHRWYDIRRYNNNDDASDDVILSRTFYPFNSSAINGGEAPITTTLDVKSRKYAFPIPNEEILISNGELEQNQY